MNIAIGILILAAIVALVYMQQRRSGALKPEREATRWLDGLLDAIQREQRQYIVIQPLENGDMAALTPTPEMLVSLEAGHARHSDPDHLLLDSFCGYHLMIGGDLLPLDSPHLCPPLPAQLVNTLHHVMEKRCGTRIMSGPGEHGRMDGFRFDENDFTREMHASVYFNNWRGQRSIKLHVKHATPTVDSWITQLVHHVYHSGKTTFTVKLVDDRLRAYIPTCGSPDHAERMNGALDGRTISLLKSRLRERSYDYLQMHHLAKWSFCQEIDGRPVCVEIVQEEDPSSFRGILTYDNRRVAPPDQITEPGTHPDHCC